MAAGTDALLVAAGALAGAVGTAGGITSLVSYPALLWAGVPPLQANVANIVALVACWPGSAVASRPELDGRGPWLRRWTAVAAAGGTAGSLLLLSTPAGVFARVAPFLVAAGSVILLRPAIAAGLRGGGTGGRGTRGDGPSGDGLRGGGLRGDERRGGGLRGGGLRGGGTSGRRPQDDGPRGDGRRRGGLRGGRLVLPCGVVALSIYNGYFGAGSGIMLLALLAQTTDRALARANALKNMLLGAASIASAVILVLAARVDWAAVAPLAAGMLAGSAIGPAIARRVPPGLLRWLVALTGLGLAAKLWIGGA
ncbi:MAG TPA: sulfite exporter TauE/SafE family protein [Trebonia sp.]|nr:sulfite exporter TauE/SafE family protein [Trebonia sp.]